MDDGFWEKAKKQKKEPLKTWVISTLMFGAFGIVIAIASYYYGYYEDEIALFFSTKSSQKAINTNELPIDVASCQKDGDYTRIQGSILNNSKKTVNFIILKLYWTDIEGDVVDTDSTYAVGRESLRPGEKSTFVGSTRHLAASHCGAELLDFKIVRP